MENVSLGLFGHDQDAQVTLLIIENFLLCII